MYYYKISAAKLEILFLAHELTRCSQVPCKVIIDKMPGGRFLSGASVKGGQGGQLPPPPLFGRIECADGSGAMPHYYLYCYLPPHFEKLLMPLLMKNI